MAESGFEPRQAAPESMCLGQALPLTENCHCGWRSYRGPLTWGWRSPRVGAPGGSVRDWWLVSCKPPHHSSPKPGTPRSLGVLRLQEDLLTRPGNLSSPAAERQTCQQKKSPCSPPGTLLGASPQDPFNPNNNPASGWLLSPRGENGSQVLCGPTFSHISETSRQKIF